MLSIIGNKGARDLNDIISQLPEDIIASILSQLTTREAARTSVLSLRWRYLWMLTPCLIFENAIAMWETLLRYKPLERERIKFVRWVDHVLDVHKCPNLEEFTVRFDLDKSFSSHLDKWITFAILKGIERLEIDLTVLNVTGVGDQSKCYTFSTDCFNLIKSPHGLSSIKSLRSLCFKYVKVSGEVVQHFLSNCPLLERLSVVGSESLVILEVAGSSLQLKYLEVDQCRCLQRIDISTPNLISFKYHGKRISFQVQNLCSLTDLSIGTVGYYLNHAFPPFLSYFPQLETLTLDMYLPREDLGFPRFPQLTNLKHLTLKVAARGSDSLLGFSQLINSSPFLNKFTLHLRWAGGPPRQEEIMKGIKCPHQCLKVVEMVGFVGEAVDVELAMFFFENAINLEKIIVNPSLPSLMSCLLVLPETERKRMARERAEQLKAAVPPRAELIIM